MREAAHRLERNARRHLNGGRQAEAAGERHGAVDQAVEAGQTVASLLQEKRHPAHIVGPRRGRVVVDLIEAEFTAAFQVERAQRHAAIGPRPAASHVSRSIVMVMT